MREVKRYFPDDFKKIMEVFPLLEADFVRHERTFS